MAAVTSGMVRFGDFVLDTRKCTLLRLSEEIRLRPKAFDVLHYLVAHPGRVISKEELIESVWGRVHVTDDALVQCMREVRAALSDNSRQVIKTIPRRGYLFTLDPRREPSCDQEIADIRETVSFCHTRDGVRIAMASIGQGLPLIRTPTWFNHLAYDWKVEFRGALYRALASECQLIRYDGRGSGLSERHVPEIAFQGFEDDLAAVTDNIHPPHYGLLGISFGGCIAAAHAARHPERISKLVLVGAYARGRNKRGSTRDIETGDAYLALMRHGWGDEHSTFLRSYGALYFPSASVDELRASADVQRMAMTGDVAVRTLQSCHDIDVVPLLSKIVAPTLVLHSRYDNAVPFEEGLRLAEAIPNARFVALESENHCPMPNEPAWTRFIDEISAFLRE